MTLMDHVNDFVGALPVNLRTDPALADELVAAVRTFVEKKVAPVVSELERADAYPDDLVDGLRDMGLFGATIPTDYGGLGLDTVQLTRQDALRRAEAVNRTDRERLSDWEGRGAMTKSAITAVCATRSDMEAPT